MSLHKTGQHYFRQIGCLKIHCSQLNSYVIINTTNETICLGCLS